jgi:hypothetical protein
VRSAAGGLSRIIWDDACETERRTGERFSCITVSLLVSSRDGDVLFIVEETSHTGLGARTPKHPSPGFSLSRTKDGESESEVQHVNEH